MSCFLGNLGTGLSIRLKFCPFPALVSADGTWIPSQFTNLKVWGSFVGQFWSFLKVGIKFRLYKPGNLKILQVIFSAIPWGAC